MFVELRFRQPETGIKDIKLKQRIISALIAIPLFLAIILFAPQPVYLAFWHVCIIACSYEFFKIRGLSKINSLILSVVMVGIISAFFIFVIAPPLPDTLTPDDKFLLNLVRYIITAISAFLMISWCIIIPIFFKKYNKNQEFRINNILLFFMWFCIISCFFAFTQMWGQDPKFGNMRYALLSILVTIWANDAGAYFIGKKFGEHKFSPIISPNKTWEGFWGGIFIATITLLTICLSVRWLGAGGFLVAFIFAPIIAIFATIGDLFQSMLKRMAGVKDSGNIMPGHGGVFDRIDSWLAVGSMIAAFVGILVLK